MIGNAVYQVQANGIKIGSKLIGSLEPLAMIIRGSGAMDYRPQEGTERVSKKYQLILLDNRAWDIPSPNF